MDIIPSQEILQEDLIANLEQNPTPAVHKTFLNHIYVSHPEIEKHGNLEPPRIVKCVPLSSNLNLDDDNPLTTNSLDSATQTSKTILQLAKLENVSFSPDSLSTTPRNAALNSNIPVEVQTEASTMHINTQHETEKHSISYMRKNLLKQYLDAYDPVPVENIYPKKSLTETFLEKRQNESSACQCRSQFLQQTSPLRNLRNQNFKSESYVDAHQNFMYEPDRKLSVPASRFTVKNVTKKPVKESYVPNVRNALGCTKLPVQDSYEYNEFSSDDLQQNLEFHVADIKHFEQPEVDKMQLYSISCGESQTIESADMEYLAYKHSPRAISPNHSFMSPTFASEQRNQQHIVKQIKHLIPSTRRGKSLSPYRSQINQPKLLKKHCADRISYIDESNCIFIDSNKEKKVSYRKTVLSEEVSGNVLNSPLKTALPYEEDLLKIDLQSLHVKTSEDSHYGVHATFSSNASCDNVVFITLSHIKNPDWSIALKGLAEMTELCRIIDSEQLYPYMITVNQKLLELLKSPRSHVCRTACQAAGHFFESMKDTRKPEFDDIVENLLYKTADSNKFIRMDANLALDCMITHIPIFHAIRSLCLKGPIHKNALVRTATIRLIVCAVVMVGAAAILNIPSHKHTRKRIIQHMAKFLEDKHQDIRKYAERLYKVLCRDSSFEINLKKYLEKDDIIRMKNTLKSMCIKR